jgi:hypothetical protein
VTVYGVLLAISVSHLLNDTLIAFLPLLGLVAAVLPRLDSRSRVVTTTDG